MSTRRVAQPVMTLATLSLKDPRRISASKVATVPKAQLFTKGSALLVPSALACCTRSSTSLASKFPTIAILGEFFLILFVDLLLQVIATFD